MAANLFDERELQAAYRAWMHADRGDHLDDAAWLRLGAGDAVQSERDVLFAHIMTCSQCSDVWRSVSFLRREAEAQGLIERRSSPRRSWFRSMFVPAAIAAALVIVTGTMMVMRRPAPVDNIVRGPAALSPVDGLMMAYAADGTPRLLWTPVPAATIYRVEIFSEDGSPLWSGDVASPPIPWPASVPRTKGTYRWRVEARDQDRTVARSRLMPVELTR